MVRGKEIEIQVKVSRKKQLEDFLSKHAKFQYKTRQPPRINTFLWLHNSTMAARDQDI